MGGRYLGDPLFDPVFDELNRRQAVAFVHPTHCDAPEETHLRVPPFVVEYVFDTTRAIVNLVFTGTLKRCPGIRLIVAHGGGAVPFLAQRISMLEGHRHAKEVTHVIPTLASLYYEIASTTAGYALRSLQELVEPTHILWGSDLPFVYGDRLQGKWLIGKNMMDSTPLPDVPLSNSTRFAFSRDWLKLAVSRVGNLSASRREGKFMNMMKPWKFTLIVLAIVFVACAGLARVGSAAEAIPFLVSYGGTAGYQLPLWVNKDLGFYKKYGIDLEIVLIQAGSPNIQALLGGSLQLTQTAGSSAMLATMRGAPVVIVATLENTLPLQLIARPEIKEPQQLRGKKIGINRFGGSNDTAVLMALKAWKMDPKEITMLQTGGTAARMAALIGKKVDATVQSYPEIFQARKLGMARPGEQPYIISGLPGN